MISQDQIYGITAVILFCLGLHGVLTRPEILRKIIAVNLMGAAVFLLLVAIAWKNTDGVVDPVPHAMVLTGIVVAISATAFALGLARRLEALRRNPTRGDGGEGSQS
jgi:multicomponent Na+:H+ antiporter subunit C